MCIRDRTTEFLNPELPGAQIKDDGIGSKYENMAKSWGKIQDLSLIHILAALFNFSNYDLTSWMTDYMDNAVGNYYTQRWYICLLYTSPTSTVSRASPPNSVRTCVRASLLMTATAVRSGTKANGNARPDVYKRQQCG